MADDRIREMLFIIITNARMIDDYWCDIYTVPTEDIEAAKKLLDETKQKG